MTTLHFVFGLIALAFVFDIFNGFHDAANSVATVVTTRVLTPVQAVFWAAFFNFVAAFLFGTSVAHTISNKLIDPKVVDVYVIFGGLIGAIAWDIITWLMALPTSSSHAIISGYAGGAIAKAGFGSLLLKGWGPVIIFLIIFHVVIACTPVKSSLANRIKFTSRPRFTMRIDIAACANDQRGHLKRGSPYDRYRYRRSFRRQPYSSGDLNGDVAEVVLHRIRLDGSSNMDHYDHHAQHVVLQHSFFRTRFWRSLLPPAGDQEFARRF